MSRLPPIGSITAILAGAALLVSGCTDGAPTAPPTPLARTATPLQETFHTDVAFQHPCEGFDSLVEGAFDEHVTTFFDAAGEPARFQIHVKRRFLITNSVTGETIIDRADWNVKVDLAAQTVTITGKVFNAKGGIRVRDLGRIVFNFETGEVLFQAGQQMARMGLDLHEPLVCEALA